jgi:hypothetical protein
MVTAGLLAAAALALSGCSATPVVASEEEPITIEVVAGAVDLSRIELSASAASRLDIHTTSVAAAGDRYMVPSAAVIIDPAGAYWVYTSPEPLVFVRHELENVNEVGQRAFFDAGPAVGTAVVTVGVPELYGAEFGIGK